MFNLKTLLIIQLQVLQSIRFQHVFLAFSCLGVLRSRFLVLTVVLVPLLPSGFTQSSTHSFDVFYLDKPEIHPAVIISYDLDGSLFR